jgi:hypothetical protein
VKNLFLAGGIIGFFSLLGYLGKTQVFPIAKPAILLLLVLILAMALCLLFVRTFSEFLGWELATTKITAYLVCFFAAVGLTFAIAI